MHELEGSGTGPGPAKVGVVVLVVVVLLIEAAVHWTYLPFAEHIRLFTIGGLAEIAIWLLLFTVLLVVHMRALPRHIYGFLTTGLAIWLTSQTADLMDEFLRQPLWLSIYGEDIARVTGMLLVALGVVALIRHSAATMHKLEYLSFHDSLTGLYNRRMLRQRTDALGPDGYSILLLDLDHFKTVNDRHGHDAGDAMLRGLAMLLLERFKGRGEVFRLGGEEFAITLEPLDDGELASLGDEVLDLVRTYRSPQGTSVSTSIGAGTRADDEPMGALMRRVDMALYAAKHAGRDRVVLAD